MSGARQLTRPTGPGNGPSLPGGATRGAGCRVPGCAVTISPQRLMCRPHWYQVPKDLRDLIWATWCSGAGLFSDAHQQAVRQAVAAAGPPGPSGQRPGVARAPA